MRYSLLWQQGGGEAPHASLGWAIDQSFGSLDALIAKVNAEGAGLQGSGWVVSSASCDLTGCLFIMLDVC